MARSSPRDRFTQQLCGARSRGIPWELTFEQWWGIWEASGKWALRGTRFGQYVMARYGDVGPYSVANVSICTASDNTSVGAGRRKTIDGKPAAGLPPVGWTLLKGNRARPYLVRFRSRDLGTFATQQEAEAARLDAIAAHLSTQP